jgi:hypothetical protein
MEVGGQVFPVNKLAVMAPWIALVAVLIIGATVVVRRQKVQS